MLITASRPPVTALTPGGSAMCETWNTSPIASGVMSSSSLTGMSAGLHLTSIERMTVWVRPPSTTPTGLPMNSSGTTAVTSLLGSIARRSTCVMSRRIGSIW